MNNTTNDTVGGDECGSPSENIVNRQHVKILTNNIRKAFEDKISYLNKLEYTELADVILLQEVNIWKGQENQYKEVIDGYEGYFSLSEKPTPCGHSHLMLSKEERKLHKKCISPTPRNGVAIFIKKGISQGFIIKTSYKDNKGRVLVLTLKNKNDHITIMNIYAPSNSTNERLTFYRKLTTVINNHVKDRTTLVLGGDTNSVWRWKDTSNKTVTNLDFTIRDFCELNKMEDAYVHKANVGGYTWKSSSSKTQKRLDSFYVKGKDLERVQSCRIIGEMIVPSDHKAVQIIVTLNKGITERRQDNTTHTNTTRVKTKKLGKEDWKIYREHVRTRLEEQGENIRREIEKCIREKNRNALDTAIGSMNNIIMEGVEEAYKVAKDSEQILKFKNKEKEEKDSETVNKAKKYIDDRPTKIERTGERGVYKKPKTNYRRRTINNKKTQQLIMTLHNIEETYRQVKKKKNELPEKLKGRLEKLKHFDIDPTKWTNWNDTTRGEATVEITSLIKKLKTEVRKEKRRFKNKKWSKYKEEMREWGWANKPDFFKRALKKMNNKTGIKRIPDHILDKMEGETDPTDPEAVKKMVQEYWGDLYKQNENISKNSEKAETTPWYGVVNPEMNKEFMDKSKTLMETIGDEEFKETLQTLKSNVAGGVDDVLNEHIKRGPDSLKRMIKEIINAILTTNITPLGWKHNRIFMIHKKKDTNDPVNYRGITLCPTLHKLLTKIIAKRLTTLAETNNVISRAQGVTKFGQSAPNHHRVLGDILEDAYQFKQEAHIAYIDLKKAYDYVEYWAVKEVLTNLNFDPKFVDLISELNDGVSGDAITPLGNTESFNIKRGLRQGCPLSPILFCIFIEPLIRWIESDETLGYRFSNNPDLVIPILAYMDDIALTAKSHEEITKMTKMLEQFLDHYGMEIGDKSAYTNTRMDNGGDSPTIQNYKIEKLNRDEPYKYLGYMTKANLNWTTNVEETKKKVDSTLNMIRAGGYDPRLKLRCIRLVSEKVAEYAFHATYYTKTQLKTLSVALKKAAKSIMRISVRTPSVSVWDSLDNGGLQIAEMEKLYNKTLATDLLNTLNYTNTSNLNYRTTIQRLKDYTSKHKYETLHQNKFQETKEYWIARALQAVKDCGLKLENTHGPHPMIRTKKNDTSIENYIRINSPSPAVMMTFNKLMTGHPERDITQIITEDNLLTYKQIMDKWSIPNFYLPHWELLRKELCEHQTTHINETTETFIQKYTNKSPFQLDISHDPPHEETGRSDTYTDGSKRENEAGCGVWNKENPELTKSFRTHGPQEIYPAEMQAALCAIARTPRDTTHHIYIDNSSVLSLCKKVSKWTTKNWRKAKNVREAKMIHMAITIATKERNSKLVWHKVKSHTGIEGNEEADRLANEGREHEDTYINDNDAHAFGPRYTVKSVTGENNIDNLYRTVITRIQTANTAQDANTQATENRTRNAVNNTPQDKRYSHWYLKYPKTTIAHTVNAFKARQDMLPHAKEAMERKLGGYTEDKCILCEEGSEDTAHIFKECPAHNENKDKMKETIYSMILKHTPGTSRKDLEAAIPCWFHTTTVHQDNFTSEEQNELINYDRLAGMLGIIPTGLKKIVKEVIIAFGRKKNKKTDKAETIADTITKRIHMHLIQNITSIWKSRNSQWSKRIQVIKDIEKRNKEGEQTNADTTDNMIDNNTTIQDIPQDGQQGQQQGQQQGHRQGGPPGDDDGDQWTTGDSEASPGDEPQDSLIEDTLINTPFTNQPPTTLTDQPPSTTSQTEKGRKRKKHSPNNTTKPSKRRRQQEEEEVEPAQTTTTSSIHQLNNQKPTSNKRKHADKQVPEGRTKRSNNNTSAGDDYTQPNQKRKATAHRTSSPKKARTNLPTTLTIPDNYHHPP